MIFSDIRTLSHDKVLVKCDYNISPKCKDEYYLEYRHALKFRKLRNDKKDICLYCSRALKSTGRNNPNCKYKELNDNMFSCIDSEYKAYLLGLIASDGAIGTNNSCIIEIHERDYNLLKSIKEKMNLDCLLKISHKRQRAILTLNSKQICQDVLNLLQIKNKTALSHDIRIPNLKSQELIYAFLRGHFDGDGSINSINKNVISPVCSITSFSNLFLDDLSQIISIPFTQNNNKVIYSGTNAIDFLGKIYANANIYLDRKYNLYKQWSNYTINIPRGNWIDCPLFNFKYKLTKNNAVSPIKKNTSDSGYDLTLIEKIKEDGNIQYYDTGITLMPDFGYYFELVPRSSLHKYGYMLANNIGIIDSTYRGNIIGALYKFDQTKPDLQLPGKYLQLIPRMSINLNPINVDNLECTSRNEGGFGSTGV